MTPSQQYRPRVVLVDDHPGVLRGLSRFLESSCEVVASVDNGEQGIAIAVRLMPDVMVVDLTMPEMDGLEVCRHMKKLAPETDVVLLTAFDDNKIETAAFQIGAAAFVAKHAVSEALESVIQGLVEKKRAGP